MDLSNKWNATNLSVRVNHDLLVERPQYSCFTMVIVIALDIMITIVKGVYYVVVH